MIGSRVPSGPFTGVITVPVVLDYKLRMVHGPRERRRNESYFFTLVFDKLHQ